MNIVEPILFQARLQPEAPALCALGKDLVSYGQLAAQMSNVARRATSFGLKRGNVVAVSIDDPIAHTVTILGLIQIGIVPVLVGRRRLPAELKTDAVISSNNYPFAPAVQQLPLDLTWLMGSGTPVETTPARAEANDTECMILLTSGTTGTPKAVLLTHRLARARASRFDYLVGNGFPTVSRVFLHLGHGTLHGFYHLARGDTIFFRGDSVENTLRSFKLFKIEMMVATPGAIVQLMRDCDQFPAIEFRLDTIVILGGSLPPSLVERLSPRLSTHLVNHYGSVETANCAAAPLHWIAHIPGAMGYVTPGAQVEIVDESGQAVPAGTEGMVRVASEFAVDYYVNDPETSAKVFRDGWFYPGDLGWLTRDKLLVVSGRRNNVLNIRGDKIAAERIEALLIAFKGVSEAAVFVAADKFGVEELWAAIVRSEAIDTASLRAYCQSQLAPALQLAHIVTLDALPVNDRGKLDRPRLKQMVLGTG